MCGSWQNKSVYFELDKMFFFRELQRKLNIEHGIKIINKHVYSIITGNKTNSSLLLSSGDSNNTLQKRFAIKLRKELLHEMLFINHASLKYI